MIKHNVEQGTDEWRRLRLGIPTASAFDKILTPTGRDSKQVDGYINDLVAEWLSGQPADNGFKNEWMERGTEMEAEAVSSYEFERSVDTEVIGFCTNDDGTVGCSPDRLIGDTAGLEVKVPKPGTHVGYLLEDKIPTKYIPQVQGCLWVTERETWDWISYSPGMPTVIMTATRDDEYIAKLAVAVRAFNQRMQLVREELLARGLKSALGVDNG